MVADAMASLRRQVISSHDIDCEIGKSWSFMRNDSNYMCHGNVEGSHKT